MRELAIMRKLNHHGVLKLYEVYEDDGHIFFVMDYLEGGELQNR